MVWLEQINDRIVQNITNNIKVANEYDGSPKPVNAEFSKAEGEGADIIDNELPKVTIRIADILLDTSRVSPFNSKREIARTEDTVTLVSYPDPYWIHYEFNIIAAYHEDVISILTQLQRFFPPRGFLMVPDSTDGEDVALFIEHISYATPKIMEQEKTKNEERKIRRFRTSLRYRITAELSREDIETFYMVKQVDIGVGSIPGVSVEAPTIGDSSSIPPSSTSNTIPDYTVIEPNPLPDPIDGIRVFEIEIKPE